MMIQPIVTSAAGQRHGAAELTPRTRTTRALLVCGVVAGPLYVAVALAQGLTRAGFDLGHDDVSLLANGHLGWIQVTNFLLTGLLVMATAAGMRRVLRGSPGGRWAPVLLGVYGAALFAAGVFRADPADGFPPGTPPGRGAVISWHGMSHIACAGIGFLALIAACFVLAHRFSGLGQRGWAIYSRLTGVVFLAGFAGIASGSGSGAAVLGFWLAVIIAAAWLAAVAAHFRRRSAPDEVIPA
jgi:Protein of unknown function (DUF998)